MVLHSSAIWRSWTSLGRRAYSHQRAMNVFDRQTKLRQKTVSANNADVEVYDYLKEEVGFRVADRIFDIKRHFPKILDLGCGRGYVSRHISDDSVGHVTMCDMSAMHLDQAHAPQTVPFTKKVADEESLDFPDESMDLVVSSLSLHWVNDLPGVFQKIQKILRPDGVFLGAMWGGDTLFELRSSLQAAETERKGGVSPHISPFVTVQDIGSLMNRAGFTMLTIDTEDIKVGYPSMLHLIQDLKGMGENNAAWSRPLRLSKDVLVAANAIYQTLYGQEDGTVPATFHVVYMIGWKPHSSQPKPLERGTGDVSLKHLYRIDQVLPK
nr:EOG090X09JT [Triops cancriformis]